MKSQLLSAEEQDRARDGGTWRANLVSSSGYTQEDLLVLMLADALLHEETPWPKQLL